jgi:nitroimidazol reductase NimA-like FMN-containing flavoprotein (pyridoxamine 5'-phosphate oxidase superfamily)
MNDAWLEPLPLDVCQTLLREHTFGRLAFVANDAPVVLPVNYRFVETSGKTWIALRTRPGNVIDHEAMKVAFEIDGIDPAKRQGWSVLVRGTLHHVDPDAAGFRERFDPEPWVLAERDAWLIIEPFAISGRRLHPQTREWAFHTRAYL